MRNLVTKITQTSRSPPKLPRAFTKQAEMARIMARQNPEPVVVVAEAARAEVAQQREAKEERLEELAEALPKMDIPRAAVAEIVREAEMGWTHSN